MHEASQLKPLRFRFTYEPDQKTYGPPGSEWWVYDESAITALHWKRQAELEELIHPLTLLEVMQGVRNDSIVGCHAASWLVIHLADPDIAGSYAEYSPRVMLIQWSGVPDGDEPEAAADPLDSSTTPS
ncbi:hypothetical protein AB0M54_24305 [Actinoplanes sp. NPDC051470]|uniref:hypothetical protein n=1 Tax=Actinoplanes sp. NPDC051470 TaxID=3157224 RepID=UPI0034172635